MSSRVCFVYPWATHGGVERVFLNRLMAFQHYAPALQVDILFLHDSGGAEPLRSALARHGVSARVRVALEFDPNAAYDLAFCVDCPQAFALCEKRGFRYVAECHTSYAENRRYLRRLPASCERVLVPSALFGDRLREELQSDIAVKIAVLRNFIPWDLPQHRVDLSGPAWVRRPLLFFGRMDAHKNPLMVLNALARLNELGDQRFFALMCGPESSEIQMLKEIERRGLRAQVLMLPPVPFAATDALLTMVRAAGGIFVSPSRGESFGLAAAEAMGVGIPVLLSDIPEHRFLVHGCNDDMVFAAGDVNVLVDRILSVAADYPRYCQAMERLRPNFSADAFMEDWRGLMKGLEL